MSDDEPETTELFQTEFEHDEDTKNTRRFEEDPEQAPYIGKLYVQKWAEGIEDSDRLRVTVEAVEE